MFPLILIIVALLTGGAVAGVADSAAPGDLLYGVDRGIEELRFQMTTDPANLSELKDAIHKERMQELQDLVARDDKESLQMVLDNLDDFLMEDVTVPELDGDLVVSEAEGNQGAYCDGSKTTMHPTGEELAGIYGVEYEEIMGWFCQGYGFGEIDLAYTLSEASGLTVEEIFGMREDGMGWGQIRAALGLKVDDDPDDLDDDPDDPDSEDPDRGIYCSENAPKDHPTGAKLAGIYGVEYEEIMGWFCQGYGFGEIDLAYALSEASGLTVEEIFGMREDGMGWGQIRAALGLEPDDEPDDQDDDPDDPGSEDPKQGTYCSGTAGKEQPKAAKLASRYGVEYQEIMDWFCQGYGFGEIDLAYTIRDFAEVPVEEVFDKRASGWGWGEIMKFYGLGGKSGQPPGQVKDKNKDTKEEKDKVKPTKKPKD